MHLNNHSKNIVERHRIFFGFFVAWFSFVSLIAPFKSSAYSYDLSTGDINLGSDEVIYGNVIYKGSQPIYQIPNGVKAKDETGTVVYNSGIDTSLFPNGVNSGPGPGGGELPTGSGNTPAAAANPEAYASDAPAGGVGDLATQAVGAAGTCSIGAILGRLLSNLIGSLIALLTSFIKAAVVKVVGSVVDCAVYFYRVCTTDPNVQNALAAQNAKNTGNVDFTVTGLFGTLIPAPSMDSIMFCIVNEILTYITQSTIKWINSGFNGNPVFVQNPGALLQTVADQEANNFMMALNGGGSQGGGGLGVEGLSNAIKIFDNPALQKALITNVLNDYNFNSPNNPMSGISQPTMSSYAIGAMARGQNLGYDAGAMQYHPSNTMIGQRWAINAEMQRRQAAAMEIQKMRMQNGNGYISPTTCAEGYMDPNTKTCKKYGIMDTHSAYGIGATIQNRDMMPYLRVALAKDFDSIITALVNQLIKIAVTEISKKTGINPQTIYSTGANIINNAGTNQIPKATPVYDETKINLDNPPAGI